MVKHRRIITVAATILLACSITLFAAPALAQTTSTKEEIEINARVEQQNRAIIDALKNTDIPSNEDKIDALFQAFEDSTKNTSSIASIKSIKTRLVKWLFNVSITLRKHAIAFYMFILISYVLLASTLGSKSLQKRKAYIVGTVFVSIVFVIFMNIPVFIIYFLNNPLSDALTIDTIHDSVNGFVYYLRGHSFSLCTILYVYGVISSQLGRDDVPRKLSGIFTKKTVLWIFLTLQLLPSVIKFIL